VKFIERVPKQGNRAGLIRRIFEVSTRPSTDGGLRTHTVSFFGTIREMLPKHIRLLSAPAPGVRHSQSDIDLAIAPDRREDVLLATFGDMMRVPGSTSSLQKEKAEGRRIRIIYSPLEALRLAKKKTRERRRLLGCRFETTSPAIAMTLCSP